MSKQEQETLMEYHARLVARYTRNEDSARRLRLWHENAIRMLRKGR